MDRENIEEILKKLGSEDVPTEVCKIAEDASEKFSETLTQSSQHFLWENIMKAKTIKLAAAAVIIIAVLTGLPFFSGKGSGVALADVLERIEQAQAFMYKMKMTMTGVMMPDTPAGEIEMESIITISNDYGMKMEMTTTDANTGKEMAQQMYILPEQKVMITIMPEQKKYTRMEFDDDLLVRIKKQNNDPRDMVKQIMNCEYTELGRSVIDGVEVEGFQTTDPAFAGGSMENIDIVLWVDVENQLPVSVEMDFNVNEQMQMSGVIYDYQWDISVDAGEFEPAIPEDFTGLPTDGMKMPSITEEAAVDGLKFLGEISGKYPKKLNFVDLMQELSAHPGRNDKIEDLTDAALKLQEEMEKMTEDERMKKTMDMMQPVQSLGMFYMMLVQDKKEPAYYGESVGPGDADAVLMRWKISDDQYRVIYGDLSAEDVTAEELAKLERAVVEQ